MNNYDIVRKKSTPSLFQSLDYTVVTLNEVKHKELTEKVSSPEPYTSGVETPTEDCKDVIFNEMKHKELLEEGEYLFNEEKNEIFLSRLFGSRTEKSKGIGTAVIRKLVSISLKRGKPLTTDASYSSHFFYLKMGMIPSQREILYCTVAYGVFALDSIRELCNCTDIKQIKNLGQHTKSYVSEILKREKSWSEKEITDEDLFENLGLFSELTNKNVSYITESFIPQVLCHLKDGVKSRPNTTRWGSIMMVMSPEGLQRWEKAIKNGFEFRLFRDYSHLRPYMTKAQHEKLDKILAPEKASSQKPNSSYRSS